MNVNENTFNGITQQLDGTSFTKCKFIECTLVYNGGEPPNLIDNQFTNCNWVFGGAAANTINFLTSLRAGGGESIVDTVLRQIATARESA